MAKRKTQQERRANTDVTGNTDQQVNARQNALQKRTGRTEGAAKLALGSALAWDGPDIVIQSEPGPLEEAHARNMWELYAPPALKGLLDADQS